MSSGAVIKAMTCSSPSGVMFSEEWLRPTDEGGLSGVHRLWLRSAKEQFLFVQSLDSLPRKAVQEGPSTGFHLTFEGAVDKSR